jgi:hypothetical protein
MASYQNLEQVLRSFDDAMQPLDDHDIHDLIAKRLKDDREAGQVPSPEAVAEWAAFMFVPEYHWRNGGWGSYYGPMWGGVTDEGKEVHTPDIHEFNSATFDYWGKRARAARHPVLKLRYADLCWEFQKRIGRVAPAIEMAHIVISSTMDATSRGLVKHGVDGKTKLARALSIALAISDHARVNEVRDAIVAYEDAVARDDALGLWGFSYDLIVDDKKVDKSSKLEAKIIDDLENRLTRLCAVREGKPVDAWGAEFAALRLAKYYRRNNRTEDVRRVLLAYGLAFEQLASGAAGMQATAWLRAVHDHYREFGLRNEAEAVLLKVREFAKRSHDEMGKYSQKLEIPKEEMERFLDHMTNGTFSDCLNRVAVEFLAEKQQVVDQLKKLRESAPLMSMMSISIVDKDGRPTAQIGGLDDDVEGRVAHQLSQNMQISGMFLYLTMDRVREKFALSGDDILNHLRQSPVFPEDGMSMIRAGL